MIMNNDPCKKPWVCVDVALQRIKDNNRGRTGREFIILGAGMAGLAAAYELTKLGHKATIIEGSDRIGGRVWTRRFNNGSYHELGAMRVPRGHDYTDHYVKNVAGLNWVAFATSSDEGFYFIRGEKARTNKRDFDRVILPEFKNLLRSEEEILRESWDRRGGPGGLLRYYMKDVFCSLDNVDRCNLLAGNFTSRLQAFDGISWKDHLESLRRDGIASSDGIELVGKVLTIRTIWDRSLAAIIRDELHKGTSEEDQRECAIEGGFDRLPGALVRLLPRGTIRFNTEVTGIDLRKRVVKLKNAPDVDFRGKQLLCTIPFSVLRHLELVGFSKPKTDAIEGLGGNYISATKIMLSYKDRFWEEQDICAGGRSISEELVLQTYYPFPEGRVLPCSEPDTVAQSAPDSGLFSFYIGNPPAVLAARSAAVARMGACNSRTAAVLLASYTLSDLSRQFCAMPEQEAVNTTVEQLGRFHEGITTPAKADREVWCWDENKWSKGALAITPPNILTRFLADAKKPEGSVYFAGEHVSIAPGWIQGALESSLREVAEMVKVHQAA